MAVMVRQEMMVSWVNKEMMVLLVPLAPLDSLEHLPMCPL